MEILAEILPLDPATGTRVVLRACSAQDRRITNLNDVRWWPAITDKPVLTDDFFDGDFVGDPSVGGATVDLAMFGMKRLDPLAPGYRYAGALVTLYAAEPGTAWPWPVVFAGKVADFGSGDEKLTLTCSVDTTPFDASAMTLFYAGTTGIEGAADLKNKVKPWCFGSPKNIEPVLIDVVDSVYQVSAYGPINAVAAVYEEAASFGAPLANHGSYAALVAAVIPAGRWATCLASGLFRLGAPAAGLITADVEGDRPSGTWIRRTGAIIARILANAGIAADRIDAASLANMDAAVPRNVSLYLTDQATLLDVVRRLAKPCNAQAGINLLGRLHVSRFGAIGAPALVLDARGSRLPAVVACSEQGVSMPYWRIESGGDRSWRVHSLSEIAFSAELLELGDYRGATTYREGNIVADQGARWLYVNATPGSGNPPPTLPATANAAWTLLTGPTDFADIGGTTKPADNATRNAPRGNYEAATAYIRGDQVIAAGSTYQLIVDASTGTAPPDAARWTLVAAAGSGLPGDAGPEGLAVIVSNEAALVPTLSDGSGGDYSTAGGRMQLLRGTTALSPPFSVAAMTPATGWITIDAAGYYVVTDPGADLGTATLRGDIAGVNFDRIYTVARGKQGLNGPVLTLTADHQGFVYKDGIADPGTQVITLTTTLSGVAGTVVWTATGGVALAGSGNTRTLAIIDFGVNRQVTVTATLGLLTDRITIVRLDQSTAAAGATVGAPAGTDVAGRPAETIVADTDANALTLLAGIFNLQDLRDYVDERLYVDGQPVNAVYSLEHSQRLEADAAINQTLGLLGVTAPGGSSFILAANTVQIEPGESLGTRLGTIRAELDDNLSAITDLDTAIAGPSGVVSRLGTLELNSGTQFANITTLQQILFTPGGEAVAKALLSVDANGRISDIELTSNGARGQIRVGTDVFILEDPDGNALLTAADGIVKMPNVEVGRIKIGAVVTGSLAAGAVSATRYAVLAADVAFNAADTVTFISRTIAKAEAGSLIEVMLSCSGSAVGNNGGGGEAATPGIGTIRLFRGATELAAGNFEGGGAFISLLYMDDALPAASYTYSATFSSAQGGAIKRGAVLKVTEIKAGAL